MSIDSNDIADQIDAMVASRTDNSSAIPVSVDDHPEGDGPDSGAVNVTSGVVSDEEMTDEVIYEHAKRIAAKDDGVYDYASAVLSLQAQSDDLVKKLQEVRYDPATGKPEHVLTGDARKRAEVTTVRVLQQLKLNVYTREAVKGIRAEQAEHKRRGDEAAALKDRWIGNDPRRRVAIDDAVLRIEAESLAHELLAYRARK